MTLETNRLRLRPWREGDAAALYQHAKNPNIGPAAGWPVHESEADSLAIICGVLSAPETYALVLKETDAPVGSIGLLIGAASNLGLPPKEGEIGYWIAEPYWGQGLIPEATQALIAHGFDELGLAVLWCGYFDGNEKSCRAQEKCGFRHHRTEREREWPLIQATKTQHITRLTREEWQRGGLGG